MYTTIFPLHIFSQELLPGGTNLTIHHRGVYESKISVLALSRTYTMQPILSEEGIKNGETVLFPIPAENLPGEFVIRFDYKENEASKPYPSEKNLIISTQDIELWVHPMFSNNTDSTWYMDGERENAAMLAFMTENYRQKEVLGMLQNFLLNYDDNQSDFYSEGIREYEKRRISHNAWIREQIKAYSGLFAATLFRFQLVPDIQWRGSEQERKQSLIDHYFDLIDFNDSLLINTRDFKSWMDQYVNIYGEQATTTALRDSLFTAAGKNAIEKAKPGHPEVYGWMVDYFFRGYESFNIQQGIAMLALYISDPNCMTQKRQAIQKRLDGMKTLIPGSIAPDFVFTGDAGEDVNFHNYNTGKPYKLLLFWSADCQHCFEMVNKLSNWYQQAGHKEKVEVLAVSLDETDTEVAEWRQAIMHLPGWKHILTEGGVNSTEANSYFILATPVMVLVDAGTNTILTLPESVEQMEAALK
ncbi:MAG: redoxin domain-containing protein [Bacteroidales bacterium]|nr:redoxin domain-containing protein [Bacteroidales bacterium]